MTVKGKCSGKSLNVGLNDCILTSFDESESSSRLAKAPRQLGKSAKDFDKERTWANIRNTGHVDQVLVDCLSVQKSTFLAERRIYTTMVVELKLTNQSPTKIVEFKGWQNADTVVEDEHGNRYGIVDFGLGFSGFGLGLWNRWDNDTSVDANSILVLNSLSLHPRKTYITYLFCMEPADVSKEARLTLPSKALGGAGRLRLRAPILSSGIKPPSEKPTPPTKSVQDYCHDLKAKDPKVRIEAAQKLGELKEDSVVLALTEVLKDEHTKVRLAAVEALGQIGMTAKPAYSDLFKALHDPSDEVAKAALSTLNLIPPSQEELPVLTAALEDQEATIRLYAIKTLVKTESLQVPVATLAIALKDRDTEIRRTATNGLAKAGLGAKTVLPDIVHALDDEDTKVRLTLILILGGFGTDAKLRFLS